MPHSFTERRTFAAEHEPFWQAFYRTAFPDLLAAFPCPMGESASQQGGIDRILQLGSGKLLTIEEKVREKQYQDILLEYVSGAHSGWIEKPLTCDFLAYACPAAGQGYLFAWPLLAQAWCENQMSWLGQAGRNENGFRLVLAANDAYETHSVAVPVKALYAALCRSSVITVPQELLKRLVVSGGQDSG